MRIFHLNSILVEDNITEHITQNVLIIQKILKRRNFSSAWNSNINWYYFLDHFKNNAITMYMSQVHTNIWQTYGSLHTWVLRFYFHDKEHNKCSLKLIVTFCRTGGLKIFILQISHIVFLPKCVIINIFRIQSNQRGC